MAQTWSLTRLSLAGSPQPTLHSTGFNPSAVLVASCVGPATSVSDGMTIDLSSHLKTKCYGGRIIGIRGTVPNAIGFQVKPATTFTSSATKIFAYRRSTGAKLSAAVALTGYKFIIEFVGY